MLRTFFAVARLGIASGLLGATPRVIRAAVAMLAKPSPFATLSFEEARKFARAMALSTKDEWLEYSCPGPYRLPKNPEVVWANEFRGWEDWLGVPLSWDEALALVRSCGVQSHDEYARFQQDEGEAARLPTQPDRYYSEFTTWEAFLGSSAPPPLPPPAAAPSSPPLAFPSAPLRSRMAAKPTASMASAGAWPPASIDSAAAWEEGVSAGPLGRTADAFFERAFRAALAAELGRDSNVHGFSGIVDLARRLVATRGPASAVAARRVLNELFPDWPPFAPAGRRGLPYWFEQLFARPFPAFSAKLNAWATAQMGQWLMGPCEVTNLDADVRTRSTVGDGVGQQVVVRRCRFLEEAACASICVNACKMPTQSFFNEDMGVPMRMVPDYKTLSCKFQFGVAPTAEDEAEARSVPCFAACPASGELRATLTQCHTMGPMAGEVGGRS